MRSSTLYGIALLVLGVIRIIGGVLAFVLVTALVALLLFMDDDDDSDDSEAEEQATEEVATETAAAALEPTATVTVAEPTETPEPEATETAVPPTETAEPDEEETEVAATETAEAEPTETEAAPTETPEADEPTATTEPEPEPTATESALPPDPSEGTLAYEADWSGGDDEWELSDGWVNENGELVSDGPDAAPLLAPIQPEDPDYAVEVEMTVAGISGCNQLAGVFARISEESNPTGDVLVGYAGNVCANEWRIDAVLEDDRDTLASGDRNFESGSLVYRLEVAGERIRLFIDGEFVGEATDDRWGEPGGVGIYRDGDFEMTVSAFRIFTLESQP